MLCGYRPIRLYAKTHLSLVLVPLFKVICQVAKGTKDDVDKAVASAKVRIVFALTFTFSVVR